MGLLDDAIRDHLELKRRRGADPTEVAREQRDALSARVRVTRLEPGAHETADGLEPEGAAAAPKPGPPTSNGSDQLGLGETRAQLDQDTAEFDMTAVLSEGGEAPQDEIPARNRIAGAATDGSQPAELTDDSLDWDFPPAEGADDAVHAVGQDSQSDGNDDRLL